MERATRRPLSPLGQPAAAARSARDANRAYRQEAARLSTAEALARLLLAYRLDHDLSQRQLAARIGTTHSLISRLESAQAPVTLTTMRRITQALGGRVLLGLELTGSDGDDIREFAEI